MKISEIKSSRRGELIKNRTFFLRFDLEHEQISHGLSIGTSGDFAVKCQLLSIHDTFNKLESFAPSFTPCHKSQLEFIDDFGTFRLIGQANIDENDHYFAGMIGIFKNSYKCKSFLGIHTKSTFDETILINDNEDLTDRGGNIWRKVSSGWNSYAIMIRNYLMCGTVVFKVSRLSQFEHEVVPVKIFNNPGHYCEFDKTTIFNPTGIYSNRKELFKMTNYDNF